MKTQGEPLLCYDVHLLVIGGKVELSKAIKMQNIDIQRAVRVGQGESISGECKAFSTVLIHHVPQRGDSLNVFIAKTVGQTGELHPAGPNKGRG